MVRSHRGRILGVVGFVGCLAASLGASAASDDRSTAEVLLKEVEASPRKDIAGDLVARSRAALDRAAHLRTAGDEAHAKLADGVARTWADAARDVTRAAVVEESAAAARLGATDAGALADRERAQLEEAIAQSGRVRAQMESLEREGKEQPARTSTAAANGDAGAHAPAKPGSMTKGADAGASAPNATPAPKTDGGVR